MKYTTIFEKLLCIFNLISDSWLSIAFIGIVTVFLILLACKKISRIKCFLFILLACCCLFGFTIYQYFEPLSEMMDTLIDDMFLNIYFPSTYAYLFVLFMIDIITVVGLINPKISKVYKTIHGTCFIIINFILTIILEMIAKYEIDVFSKKSLFSNTDLITLLEFSVNIFIGWLIVLLLVYLINMITDSVMIARDKKDVLVDSDKKDELELVVSEENKELSSVVSDKIIVPAEEVQYATFTPDTTQNHFIPEFNTNVNSLLNAYSFESVVEPVENQFVSVQSASAYEEVKSNYADNYQSVNDNTFDLSSFIPKKQEIRPIQSFNESSRDNQVLEQILRNELPVIQEKKVKDPIELEKDTYTLNDYRVFNKMLKDIREHNQSNSVSIDKNLEYRLITKYSTETYHMFQKMLKIYSN